MFALAMVVPILFAACRDSDPVGLGPGKSPVPDRVIPWSPRLASPTASPMPTPTLPSCHAADIQASFERWGVAAGSVGGSFRLVPTSAPCVVSVRPSFRFMTSSGELIAAGTAPPAAASVPVVPAVGKGSTFILVQWSNHSADSHWRCGARSQPIVALEIHTAGEWAHLAFAGAPPTLCIDPAESVFVEAIAQLTTASVYPEPISDATILAPPEVSRGEHMRYLVELRNRSLLPFRFTDCPAFVHNIAGPQGLGGGDAAGFRFIEHRQILNCAGVGAIAPGEQITFEMYFDIPTDVLAGTYVLPWRLDGPIYSTGYKVSFEIGT